MSEGVGSLIVGESGNKFQMGVSFDMSAQTALEFTFTKPDGTTLVVAGVLDVNPFVDQGFSFAANESAFYIWLVGDLDQDGDWTARLQYTDVSLVLISTISTFEVDP